MLWRRNRKGAFTMTYTYCEAAMWHIMMPAAFRYLSQHFLPCAKRYQPADACQCIPKGFINGLMSKSMFLWFLSMLLWRSVRPGEEANE